MSEKVYYIQEPRRKEVLSELDLDDSPPPRRPRRSWRLPWRLLLILVLTISLVGAGLWIFRHPVLVGLGRFLDVSQTLQPAEYVLVLSGRPHIRPFYAAALYRAGLVGAVVVSRPESTPDEEAGILPSQLELTRGALEQSGVPAIDILELGGEMTSTQDEIRALAAFMEGKPSARFMVLTSAQHTRRARQIVGRTLGDAAGRVRMLGVPEDHYSAADWWRSPEGFLAYTGEYMKIPVNWIVY